jgi:hypothetical protein
VQPKKTANRMNPGRKQSTDQENVIKSEVFSSVTHTQQARLTLPKPHQKQYELIYAFELNPGVRFVAGACGTKFGKGHPIDSKVPTPNGWKTIGELKEGDHVFDENGRPTLVEFVTDLMYDKPVYDVVFQDGAVERVSGDHLWATETHACRKANARVVSKNDRCKSTNLKTEVVDTEHIKNTLTVTFSGRNRPNHSIIVCGPVQYPAQNLLLDPYVLGAWLGDGSTNASSFACNQNEPDIIDNIRSAGFEVTDCKQKHVWNIKDITKYLRALGVLTNKHVPYEYTVASIEQRLALLQGLMDTDGTIGKLGQCAFYNTNKSIADAVYELVCSLGIKATRAEKLPTLNGSRVGRTGNEYKKCYIIHFTTDLPVFRLKRKLERIRPVALKAKRRYIVDVVPVPSVPVKCIRVANDSHLYLTGQSYIVTHNTYGCTTRIVKEAWENQGSLNWWVAPTYDQSVIAMQLVKKLIPDGFYLEYKADRRIVILNPDGTERSQIHFKSGENPDNLRGYAVNFFIIDEAARIPYDSFVSVMTTVTQTKGRGIVISTPKGRGWFYTVYQRGEKFLKDGVTPKCDNKADDPWKEWMAIRMPTSANPFVDAESIATAKKNLPSDVFQQEYEAEFLDESAGVFRGIQACVKGTIEPSPISGHYYVIGVDLARIRDYTVLTVMDRQRKHVVNQERFTSLAWEVQYMRIRDIAARYNGALCVVDSTGIGDPICESLRAGGVAVEPYKIGSHIAKQQLIEKLRVSIEQGRISFPKIPAMLYELEIYEYNVTDAGVIRYSAPDGEHDDTIISLALATWVADSDPFYYKFRNQRGI